jgi:hypothetical protein
MGKLPRVYLYSQKGAIMTNYCANDPCESEATHMIVETKTPLCYTCYSAYLWGQSEPGVDAGPIEDYYTALDYIAAKYISPQDLSSYNYMADLPKDIHISLNSACVIREWDERDDCALVSSEDFPDEEVWVLQSWLKEV